MALPTEIVGPFDVRTDDLMQIDPAQAVELFRQLLVIEAATIGLPAKGADVPASISVTDGGIDADVAGVAGESLPAGLIAEGKTCYQMKSGDFSASTPSAAARAHRHGCAGYGQPGAVGRLPMPSR